VTDRRRFLTLAAASAVALLESAGSRAQGRVFRIGYLMLRAGPSPLDEAFLRRLRERGYSVGRDVVIDFRWAGSNVESLGALAEDLVRQKPDVVVTATVFGVRAAMRATTTIPIVMAAVADPVGSGLVRSLARPGANVTGMTLASTDLARKRLQLLREFVPGATRIAVLGGRAPESQTDAAFKAAAGLPLAETQAAAQQLGAGVVARMIAGADELVPAFEVFRKERAQALVVQVSPQTLSLLPRIVDLAAQHRLPALYDVRNFVDGGGLVSYGPDLQEMYRRAAEYVDRLLRGARPGELPIEQPTKFELVVNLKTAKALELAIPRDLLLRADEVIR
jgi:putative ABC transport system substrate-binding protein